MGVGEDVEPLEFSVVEGAILNRARRQLAVHKVTSIERRKHTGYVNKRCFFKNTILQPNLRERGLKMLALNELDTN